MNLLLSLITFLWLILSSFSERGQSLVIFGSGKTLTFRLDKIVVISAVQIFIFSCLVSFVGSLQLGPVNLVVINTALFKGKRNAYLVAIGGSIPEFMYCALAVLANHYLLEYDWLILSFKLIFIALLIIIGFVLYFKKQSPLISKNEPVDSGKSIKYVFKGFSLAMFNPQLLPFWIFVQLYFNSIRFLHIQSNAQKIAYILGAGIGAFILLAFFILIVSKYRETMLKYVSNKYYFKALSLLFFAIAIHQIWLLFNS